MMNVQESILPMTDIKREQKSELFPFGECRICQDTATGVHYGVISCEGCKGFFKRCTTHDVVRPCSFDNRCVINVDTRNGCRSCRFNRCVEQGMSLDNVKMGRIPKKVKEKALRKYQKRREENSNLQASSTIISLTDSLSYDLSLLHLPTIFSPSSFFPSPNSMEMDADRPASNENILTVSKYISTISDDYIFNYEIRYSNNVLRIMKYLLPKLCQPYLIFELDLEVMSFFRYLRWKVFDFYFKHTKNLRGLIQRMFRIIHLGIKDYPGVHATYEQMWSDVQAGLPNTVKEFLQFAQDILGINELNLTDFTRIMNNRIFDFWLILHYPLFYKNESYIMTSSGLQYSRRFMNRFIGKATTDALHEFTERLHALNITQIEHSLLIPIVLCQPDSQFIDPEIVHVVKHCYMFALYIQLCSTRTEEQAKVLFDNILEIIDHIRVLNELSKEHIGKLVIDKTRDDCFSFSK